MTFFQAFLDVLFLYGGQGVWGSSTPKNVLNLEIQVFWRKKTKKKSQFFSIGVIRYWGSDTGYFPSRYCEKVRDLWFWSIHDTISSGLAAAAQSREILQTLSMNMQNLMSLVLNSLCHARNHDRLPAKKLKDDKCMLSVDGLARFVICGHGECCRQCNLKLYEK